MRDSFALRSRGFCWCWLLLLLWILRRALGLTPKRSLLLLKLLIKEKKIKQKGISPKKGISPNVMASLSDRCNTIRSRLCVPMQYATCAHAYMCYLDYLNWGGEISAHWECQSRCRPPTVSSFPALDFTGYWTGREWSWVVSLSSFLSGSFEFECAVRSCFKFLLSWLVERLGWNVELQANINTFVRVFFSYQQERN